MKSLVALVVFIVAGLVLALMFRLGSFKPVEITEVNRPAMKVVYKAHVGAYHKIVPVIEEVEKWVKANGESCELSFGEYYDDPDEIAEDRLRSNGGCIVPEKPAKSLPDGFKYREVPAHFFVVAEFEGAPSIGPIKVYPRAERYIREHKFGQFGPIFEVYKLLPNEQVHTTYLFPVVKIGEPDTVPVGEPAK